MVHRQPESRQVPKPPGPSPPDVFMIHHAASAGETGTQGRGAGLIALAYQTVLSGPVA